jgi:hypothetical protein
MKPFKALKKFKVLIGIPHNEIKNYCLEDLLSTTTNLTYDKQYYDILIADNSKSSKNVKKIIKRGVDAIHVKPKQKPNQQYIAESHEALRLAALNGDYDFLLHWEDDITPPLNIIEQLLSHQKSVVAASYFINHGHDSHLMIQQIEEQQGSIRHTLNFDKNFDILQMDGKLKRVYSVGLGCVLIHKTVLKKIKFRWEKGMNTHSDSVFSADLQALNIPIYLDTSILCNHNNSSWSEVTDLEVVKSN